MPIIRVNKTKDYTVMSNTHFRDSRLTLKAKGLLSLMLSLPEDWDYSIKGLVAISKEKETSIKNAIAELRSAGYIVVTKMMPDKTTSGRIEYIYNIYESPQKQAAEKQKAEKQGIENLPLEFQRIEKQGIENQGQLNTDIQNTENKIIKDQKTKEDKKIKYAEFVSMTEEEYQKLISKYGQAFTQRAIEILDNYKGSRGKRYKSDYRTILNWVVDRVNEELKKGGKAYGRTEPYRGCNTNNNGTFTPSQGFKK